MTSSAATATDKGLQQEAFEDTKEDLNEKLKEELMNCCGRIFVRTETNFVDTNEECFLNCLKLTFGCFRHGYLLPISYCCLDIN